MIISGITLDYNFNNNIDDICSENTLVAGIHTVAATYDKDKTKIYIDGEFENNSEYSPSVIEFDGITIGATELKISTNITDTTTDSGTIKYTYNYEKFLNSNVYSVRIYKGALTDTEIKQNYIIDNIRFGSGR